MVEAAEVVKALPQVEVALRGLDEARHLTSPRLRSIFHRPNHDIMIHCEQTRGVSAHGIVVPGREGPHGKKEPCGTSE